MRHEQRAGRRRHHRWHDRHQPAAERPVTPQRRPGEQQIRDGRSRGQSEHGADRPQRPVDADGQRLAEHVRDRPATSPRRPSAAPSESRRRNAPAPGRDDTRDASGSAAGAEGGASSTVASSQKAIATAVRPGKATGRLVAGNGDDAGAHDGWQTSSAEPAIRPPWRGRRRVTGTVESAWFVTRPPCDRLRCRYVTQRTHARARRIRGTTGRVADRQPECRRARTRRDPAGRLGPGRVARSADRRPAAHPHRARLDPDPGRHRGRRMGRQVAAGRRRRRRRAGGTAQRPPLAGAGQRQPDDRRAAAAGLAGQFPGRGRPRRNHPGAGRADRREQRSRRRGRALGQGRTRLHRRAGAAARRSHARRRPRRAVPGRGARSRVGAPQPPGQRGRTGPHPAGHPRGRLGHPRRARRRPCAGPRARDRARLRPSSNCRRRPRSGRRCSPGPGPR